MMRQFINEVELEALSFLETVIKVNTRIAEEGLKNNYGMGVGKHIYDRMIKNCSIDFQNYVISYVAARVNM